jgi:hypothetical protein
VDTDGDLGLVHSILSMFENLSHLKMDFVKFQTPRHAHSIVWAAAGRLTHLELNDLDVLTPARASYPHQYPERTPGVIELGLTHLTVSMTNTWTLDLFTPRSTTSSLRHLSLTHDALTGPRRDPDILLSTWRALKTFLSDLHCRLTDLDVDNFAASLGSSRLNRLFLRLQSKTILRYTMRARTIRKAEHALHLLEISEFATLTHVTLHFDLDDCDCDLPQYSLDVNDHETSIIRAYPNLRDVTLVTPDDGAETDQLKEKSGFLNGCRLRGILRTSSQTDK